MRYINQQLHLRRQIGKAVAIVGISASLLSVPACAGGKKPVKQATKAKNAIRSEQKKEMVIGATGGGVTFGGGEPLLHSSTIADFCRLCPTQWNINVETSLNVPRRHLAEVMPYVHRFIIDVKDMNPKTYQRYTGRSNRSVLANLAWLARYAKPGQVVVRLPNIPQFNTPADVARSRRQLEDMGFTLFDCFDYLLP